MHWIACTAKCMRWRIHWMPIVGRKLENVEIIAYICNIHGICLRGTAAMHINYPRFYMKSKWKMENFLTHKLCRPKVVNRNSNNMRQHLAWMAAAAVDHTAFYADTGLQSNCWSHPVHFPVMMVWLRHTVQPLRLAYGPILVHHCRLPLTLLPLSMLDSQPNSPAPIGLPAASILIGTMAMTDHYATTGCHYNCKKNEPDFIDTIRVLLVELLLLLLSN